jgi:hypothetical protein
LHRAAAPQFLECTPHCRKQLFVRERLGQVFLSACLDGIHGAADGGVAGDHHHFRVLQVFPDMPDQIETAKFGHLQVRDDQVHRRLLQNPDGAFHARSRQDLIPL